MSSLFEKMRTTPNEIWLAGLKRETDTYDWCQALPSLPDEQFQRRFVGKAYGDAMQQAYEAVERFKHGVEQVGCHFGKDDRVLDFGCGWGRISQSLYRYFRPENIISADIQEEALDFCKESGLATSLMHVSDNGLSLIVDESIDFIFAYSVFSHLTEELANAWISEYLRILKPGGAVALTTRTSSIIRHAMNLQQLPSDQIPQHAKGIAEAFHDADNALQAYSEGKFVYRDLPALTKVGKGYGEALIPEKYVLEHWHPLFAGGSIYLAPIGAVDQAVIILKKR